MFQVFHVFQAYVANVSSGCFKSRSCVAHVVVAVHTSFKRMLQVFQLFQTYVANILFGCFKSRSGVVYVAMTIHTCFKRMFQVFCGTRFVHTIDRFINRMICACNLKQMR
jgi:hypothetical protein